MDEPSHRLASVLLLGASFIALGGLLWLWSQDDPAPETEITVHQRIVGPDDGIVFNGSIVLTPANATALGALLGASEEGGFSVNVTYSYYGKAFVQDIAGIRNEGACGWVFDHNEVRASRSADDQVLAHQDRLRWSWDCEG